MIGILRGGLGVDTIYKVGSEDTQIVTFGDGDFEAAFGLFGGGGGTLNSITLELPDGEMQTPLNKDLLTGVPKGTVYRQRAGGGGGYGDPKKRPPEIVAREVKNGIVSAKAAREVYGAAHPPVRPSTSSG